MKTTVDQRESLAIVRVDGEIVRENQQELRSKIEELLSAGATNIALDLERVDYMDSAALGCCASVQKGLKDKGVGSLVVFGASPNIQKMWKLIRLDLMVPIFEEEKEVLKHFAAAGGAP